MTAEVDFNAEAGPSGVTLAKGFASVDTLKNRGLNPNSIVLLPQWNDPAGH